MLQSLIDAVLGRQPEKARVWVLDRLDDGRRVVGHGWDDGRKLLNARWDDGVKLFDRSLKTGRKELDHRADDGRKLLDHRLDDGRKLVQARLADGRAVLRDNTGSASVLVPTVIAVAGAGAAIWWWTQYSRGKAEAAARAAAGKPEGGGEVPIDHAEMVMAHNAAPEGTPDDDAPHPSDAKLSVPAEQVLAHSPVDPNPPNAQHVSEPWTSEGADAQAPAKRATRKKGSASKDEALAHVAAAALQAAPKEIGESLGVKGSATAPKTGRGRKGPTIM